MQGIELDSLLGTINSEITWLGFNDRAFLPFNFNSDISISDPGKTISLKSDFFTIDVIGKYSLAEILESLSFQGEYLANYFINKIDSFNHIEILNSDTLDLANQFPMMYNFPNIDAVFRAEILDLSPVNLFVDSMSIYSGIKLDVRMMSSENQSSIFLDSIKLDNFDFYSKDLQLKTGPLFLEGRIITTLSDSQLSIENLVLSIDTSGSISYNGTEINSLFTQLSYDGSNLGYNISGILESDFKINSAGKIGLNNSDISFRSDSTSFEYGGLFKWNTTEPIKAHISPEIINIEKFVFERDSSETISLSGSIENNIAKDLSLKINNFPITDFLAFSSDDTKEKYEGVKFTVDSIRIRANGDLNEPRIVSFFALDSIVFSDYQIGNLRGRMIHNNTYIHGFVDIVHPALENKKILGIEVNYLPLYLGTNPNVARLDSNKMMDIRLKAAGLPLEILTPFAVGVKEMTGFLDANIVVEGSILKGIEYSGSASTENAIVKIQNTNIAYNTDLKVDFVKDKITLTKVSLKNLPQDVRFGRLGKADINGSIGLKDFDIGELDITLNADRLLVMSDATMVPMPDLYGDFIISTEKNHLRFYGTLDKPNLVGDVNIIHGHLKMPMESKKQNIRTYFTYTVMDDKVRLQSNTMKDTNYKANEKLDAGLSPSIADLINYDLSAKILGKFIVEMDMDLIGSMYAVIGTQDRLQTLRYEKKRDWNEGKLFGEVVVMEPSTIKSWKQFSARGTINFPAGSIENPSLNLKALHTGQMVENGTRKEFVVEMTITGPKDNPVIDMTYYIDGVKASGAVDQIKEDALYLLVMGRTKTGTGGGSPNSSLLNEGFASGVSNFATKALSDILMGTGVINSAEFDFQGGSMNLGDARLRLTGQLYGGISWTIGGTVADLSSNNQITIDIPASEFSNNPFWSNFVLQLSKASSNVIASSQEAKNWEVKVKLGSSW
jgi:hypothetical protein